MTGLKIEKKPRGSAQCDGPHHRIGVGDARSRKPNVSPRSIIASKVSFRGEALPCESEIGRRGETRREDGTEYVMPLSMTYLIPAEREILEGDRRSPHPTVSPQIALKGDKISSPGPLPMMMWRK